MSDETGAQPSLPKIPRDARDDHSDAAVRARQALWRETTGAAPRHVAGEPVPPSAARGKCENLVGFAQVPLGIAGPLLVDTSAGPRAVYVPMATTEGAMVASYSRGMRLVAAGGGAWARVVREGLTQNPVLVHANAREALAAAEVARAALPELQALVATTTRHGALVDLRASTIGRRLVASLV